MKIADMHILVLEDDDFQRRMVANMCRSLGPASVSEAADGKQALQIIGDEAADPVNVVLCDLQMPGMDGMEFLRHLSEERSEVGIVITSALDGNLLASVGRMAKVYGIRLLGIVEKPIVLAHLKELLASYESEERKWQKPPTDAKNFTLDEILQGIDANQFQPFFQPKVDLKSGRLIGAEALARWLHPQHGVIDPYAFIPLLEQSGKIDDLTFQMLEKSASACRSFHDKGQILAISVNLSLSSLADPTLADKVTHVVRSAGIEPQYIVLEITESAAMTDVAYALENLARLRMNGFALSIDDYGTGYSSLQQLTRIAFNELKIDQSFVQDFTANEALRIVVESSVDMAHKLKIKSTAEGVETQNEWDTLRSVGCDTAQGYFISKPLDITAFYEFMASYSYKSPAISPRPATALSKTNILVVDDNNFERKIIVRVLHDLGFAHIADTNGGAAALKLLESNTYDLIINDVCMPEISGLMLIQLIRSGKTHAKPDTRVMVVTSFSQAEILGAALALDINGFLVKPIIPAVLDEKIAQALSERLHLHPPLAYEAVKTVFKSLPSPDHRPPSRSPGMVAISRGEPKAHDGDVGPGVRRVAIQKLLPGMVLKDNLHLENEILLLSPGHVFTVSSINRLNDLKGLLKEGSVLVQEAPMAG